MPGGTAATGWSPTSMPCSTPARSTLHTSGASHTGGCWPPCTGAIAPSEFCQSSWAPRHMGVPQSHSVTKWPSQSRPSGPATGQPTGSTTPCHCLPNFAAGSSERTTRRRTPPSSVPTTSFPTSSMTRTRRPCRCRASPTSAVVRFSRTPSGMIWSGRVFLSTAGTGPDTPRRWRTRPVSWPSYDPSSRLTRRARGLNPRGRDLRRSEVRVRRPRCPRPEAAEGPSAAMVVLLRPGPSRLRLRNDGVSNVGDLGRFAGRRLVRLVLGDGQVVTLNADARRDAVRRYLNEVTAHGPEAPWQVRRNRRGRINRIEFGSAGSPTAGWSATCTRPPTMKVNSELAAGQTANMIALPPSPSRCADA